MKSVLRIGLAAALCLTSVSFFTGEAKAGEKRVVVGRTSSTKIKKGGSRTPIDRSKNRPGVKPQYPNIKNIPGVR